MERTRLAEIYDSTVPKLHRFLCGFLGSIEDAEDVIQNVFSSLMKQNTNEIDDVEAYLWTAARNQARKLCRKRKESFLIPVDKEVVHNSDQTDIEETLRSLPDEQREVVILHVFEELTFPEIADYLEISTNTANSRFRYAKEKLKRSLHDSLSTTQPTTRTAT